jgi:glycosyltransferase involved in cell wall biosynthesis
MSPQFTVVIPAYNVAPFIGETLASVAAQTFRDYETVVVNDGSQDTEQLERVLAPYRENIRYIKQENRGLAGARNTALRAARGRYLAFLDGDDYWEPDCLETQHKLLAADPSIDVLYGDAVMFGNPRDEGRKLSGLCPSQGPVNFESLVSQKCVPFVSAAVARRELVERVGLFDESLRSSEDFELWVRIARAGGNIQYHRHVILHYRRRPESLSGERTRFEEGVLRSLNKVMLYPDLTPGERQVLESKQAEAAAKVDWSRGQRAVFENQPETAIRHWKEANRHFKTIKLSAMVALLRIFPGAISRLYRLSSRARLL